MPGLSLHHSSITFVTNRKKKSSHNYYATFNNCLRQTLLCLGYPHLSTPSLSPLGGALIRSSSCKFPDEPSCYIYIGVDMHTVYGRDSERGHADFGCRRRRQPQKVVRVGRHPVDCVLRRRNLAAVIRLRVLSPSRSCNVMLLCHLHDYNNNFVNVQKREEIDKRLQEARRWIRLEPR